MAAVLISGVTTWSYTLLSQAGAQAPTDGPIRRAEDIPADVQAVLQQAPAPTHDRPTRWGLLLINPVIGGDAAVNSDQRPLPPLNGPDVRRGKAEGKGAFEQLAAQGLPVMAIPEPYRKGMDIGTVLSIADGNQFWTVTNLQKGEGTPDYLSLQVEAFTPTAPVPFEEFPDNAIRDFVKSNAVRGNPTLTVFPDKGTSNPRNERIVAWSQDGAVYIVKSTGLYPDEELLELAAHISDKEASR